MDSTTATPTKDPGSAAAAELPPSRGTLLGRLFTAVLLLAGLIGAGVIALQWEPRLLPIRVVTVEGEMHGLSRQSLEDTIAEQITGGILTQDLAALKAEVEALPWIHRAAVRRAWPDHIAVTVSEHEAVARWGENGLVTADGIVFRPRDGRLPAGLARLDAADDAQAAEVVERLLDWGPRLMGLGLLIDGISRDARGDWSLKLLGGTELMLGTNDIDSRFERLIAAYPQVEAIGIPARVDLRYSNGLAVRWVPSTNIGGAERVAANMIRKRS
jgi:cell division protein FtsQ